MKRRDFLILIILVLTAVIGFVIAGIANNKSEDSKLVITLNGETSLEMPLDETTNDSFQIETQDGHWNDVVITNGVVDVVAADCPNQICVETKTASKNGDMIVCLPHQLVIEIVPYEKER